MSMDHKAFLFDTVSFNKELANSILDAGTTHNVESLHKFIHDNIGRTYSIYTGEPITSEWENELQNGDVQELADYALTCFYSPEEDIGLSCYWDALLNGLGLLPLKHQVEYYIIGRPLTSGDFVLDPGFMGLGFVYFEDIPHMYNELVSLKKQFIHVMPRLAKEFDDEITMEDLSESYNELIQIYECAKAKKSGLMMTF